MKKPDWNFRSNKNRRAMAEWLDYMLDDHVVEIEQEESDREARMPLPADFDTIGRLIRRLRAGKATIQEQVRAANLIVRAIPAKQRKLRQSRDSKQSRRTENPALTLALKEVERIKHIWWENYEKDYRIQGLACEFSAKRNADEWAYWEYGSLDDPERFELNKKLALDEAESALSNLLKSSMDMNHDDSLHWVEQ